MAVGATRALLGGARLDRLVRRIMQAQKAVDVGPAIVTWVGRHMTCSTAWLSVGPVGGRPGIRITTPLGDLVAMERRT